MNSIDPSKTFDYSRYLSKIDCVIFVQTREVLKLRERLKQYYPFIMDAFFHVLPSTAFLAPRFCFWNSSRYIVFLLWYSDLGRQLGPCSGSHIISLILSCLKSTNYIQVGFIVCFLMLFYSQWCYISGPMSFCFSPFSQ
jgi:hypothetical protein